MSGNHLNLLLTDSNSVEIAVPRKFKFVLANFAQLFSEFLNHQKMLESLVSREGSERFSDFAECFNYAGGPFVRATEALLSIAKLERLSDVHFEPDKDQVRITFRQAGRVICAGYISPEKFNRLLARMKYLAGCRSHVFDQAQEGAFHDEKTSLDVRLSSFPTNYGERLALRFIQPIHFSSLDKLGWNSPVVEEWRRLLQAKSGLFVISGAVGSGKTTALYASLAELACSHQQLRAVTIEDPVEARIPGICQSSLETMRGLDLAAAFKHLLRQDPDIIALGEIRDRECLREALQAGLSGHRVLATFHAGRGGETMARFSRIGLEDSMISQGLRGIIHLEL
ncbi:MAG: ATPase, T2SS/T4P/T4SS family, partial [Candidatus Riflebacteria bacterium]